MDINDEKLGFIINMDEAPIYFEMPQKIAIGLKDTKNAKITTL